jgi:hypothetical protein
MKGNLGYLNVDPVLAIEAEQAFSVTNIVTWHPRLRHCNFPAILNHYRRIRWKAYPYPTRPCLPTLASTVPTENCRKLPNTSTPVRTNRPLEGVHSDVVSPMNVQDRSGERYVVVFLDGQGADEVQTRLAKQVWYGVPRGPKTLYRKKTSSQIFG